MHEFMSQYGWALMYTILTSILSYAFIAFKKEVSKFVKLQEKKEVVKTCVLGLRHMYKEKSESDRYDLALVKIKEIFDLRKISVSEFEIRLLIDEICEKMDCSHIDL